MDHETYYSDGRIDGWFGTGLGTIIAVRRTYWFCALLLFGLAARADAQRIQTPVGGGCLRGNKRPRRWGLVREEIPVAGKCSSNRESMAERTEHMLERQKRIRAIKKGHGSRRRDPRHHGV